MTTARINNHINKGDAITVGFNPNSLKINKELPKIELLASIYYDHTNITSIEDLKSFINRNTNKTISFTYKNICVVGYMKNHNINYISFNTSGHPTGAKVEITIQEK